MITEPSGWHCQQSFPSRVLQHLHQRPCPCPHPSLRGSLRILVTMTTVISSCTEAVHVQLLCTGYHRGHNPKMTWSEDQIDKAKRDA